MVRDPRPESPWKTYFRDKAEYGDSFEIPYAQFVTALKYARQYHFSLRKIKTDKFKGSCRLCHVWVIH